MRSRRSDVGKTRRHYTRGRKRTWDADEVVVDNAHEDHVNLFLCHLCKQDLSLLSEYKKRLHMERCAERSVLEDRVMEDDVIYNVDDGVMEEEAPPSDHESSLEEQDEVVEERRPINSGDPPSWAKTLHPQYNENNAEQLTDADAMLVAGLRASGCKLSDETMRRLFAILNTSEWKTSFQKGELSKSYNAIKKHDQMLKSSWQKVSLCGGRTVAYVRDLQDVLLDMCQDAFLWDSMQFERHEYREQEELVWKSHWTHFPVYQEMARRWNNNVNVLCLAFWADAGESARGRGKRASSVEMLCVVPLNAPPSVARRKDCFQQIATFESSGTNTMVDVIQYFLPQLEALRDYPRYLPGQAKQVVVNIGGIIGDNPAVTELLGTMGTASSMFPCKMCWLERDRCNDPSKWNSGLRTQKECEKRIGEMRMNPNFTQTESGMRNENKDRDNPLFQYYNGFSKPLDVFSHVMWDKMHDVYLGLLKECFQALGKKVFLFDKDVRSKKDKRNKLFLEKCELLSRSGLRGFDATLMRKSDRAEKSETTLLHILSGGHGSLMAREMQSLAPILPLVFDALKIEHVSHAIEPLCRLVHFCTALESREWPVNGSDAWWDGLRRFGIDAYKDFRNAMSDVLPKEKRTLKIHTVLAHALEVRRRHGSAGDVQPLEGQFGTMKSMTTNHKDVALPLVVKHGQIRQTQQFLASDSAAARALRNIVDDPEINREPNSDCTEGTLIEVKDCAARFLVENGATLERWVKWVRKQAKESDGRVDRGEATIYAAPSWHGNPKYDTIELEDGNIFQLQGIGLCRTREGTNALVGVGFNLIRHPTFSLELSYRMPVLRKLSNHGLTCRFLDIEKVHVVMVIPHLKEHTAAFKNELYSTSVPRSVVCNDDHVYHLNIFSTHGSLRYHNETVWFPAGHQALRYDGINESDADGESHSDHW